jgi:hypothetical protein
MFGWLWHDWITNKWFYIQKQRENTTCPEFWWTPKTKSLKLIIFDQHGFSMFFTQDCRSVIYISKVNTSVPKGGHHQFFGAPPAVESRHLKPFKSVLQNGYVPKVESPGQFLRMDQDDQVVCWFCCWYPCPLIFIAAPKLAICWNPRKVPILASQVQPCFLILSIFHMFFSH